MGNSLTKIDTLHHISYKVAARQEQNDKLRKYLSAHRDGKLQVSVSVGTGFGKTGAGNSFQGIAKQAYLKYCVDTIRDNEKEIEQLLEGVHIVD